MKVFKSILATLSLALVAPALAADRTDGGHDGGGANLWTSNATQVREAIDWAIAEIREDKAVPGGGPNWLFFASVYTPDVNNAHGKEISVGMCLKMPFTCDIDQMMEDIENGKPVFHKAWDYLKLSRLTLKEDGPCPARDKEHAAGSVSAFKPGADLCLSVYELSRTPPGALRAQVASVLAHEMAHLLGFDEVVATGVQKGIVENFGEISRSDGRFLAYRVVGAMMYVDSALFNARSFSKPEAMGIGYYLVGYAGGILHTIVEMLPDGINDRTIPVTDPALFSEVKKSLESLEGKLLELAWKPNLTKAAFDQRLEELRKEYLEASLLLEKFLGQEVHRFPKN